MVLRRCWRRIQPSPGRGYCHRTEHTAPFNLENIWVYAGVAWWTTNRYRNSVNVLKNRASEEIWRGSRPISRELGLTKFPIIRLWKNTVNCSRKNRSYNLIDTATGVLVKALTARAMMMWRSDKLRESAEQSILRFHRKNAGFRPIQRNPWWNLMRIETIQQNPRIWPANNRLFRAFDLYLPQVCRRSDLIFINDTSLPWAKQPLP